MIEPGLKNQVVLVTGANSGIGAQVAQSFVSQGACVVVHYLEDATPPADSRVSIQHEIRGRDAAEAILSEIHAAGRD